MFLRFYIHSNFLNILGNGMTSALKKQNKNINTQSLTDCFSWIFGDKCFFSNILILQRGFSEQEFFQTVVFYYYILHIGLFNMLNGFQITILRKFCRNYEELFTILKIPGIGFKKFSLHIGNSWHIPENLLWPIPENGIESLAQSQLFGTLYRCNLMVITFYIPIFNYLIKQNL